MIKITRNQNVSPADHYWIGDGAAFLPSAFTTTIIARGELRGFDLDGVSGLAWCCPSFHSTMPVFAADRVEKHVIKFSGPTACMVILPFSSVPKDVPAESGMKVSSAPYGFSDPKAPIGLVWGDLYFFPDGLVKGLPQDKPKEPDPETTVSATPLPGTPKLEADAIPAAPAPAAPVATPVAPTPSAPLPTLDSQDVGF